ncbi:neural cell adhesion molecule 1-like isoform X4 [Dunckerocampus dactyliophorus]|uniref:neural cell adhesion molecule 1-like isoform X4 n=2 Tax=Dunckerocampus dactyliophorus TaxID=161453 RepID=UPI002406DA13|nr:neural cell adhesion molecule 1-like isoform X4 [Dunckerocampus dactyliophorus]
MLQIRNILLGLLYINCAAAIQVQITPPQGQISVGDSKFFLCEVVGDVKDIDWYTPSGEKILPNNPNIHVNRNDETSSALIIYHADVDDAGIYMCVAKNGDKEAQATVQVKIFQKITFKNVPSPQEFNEGDDADIVCDVIGSPPPFILWKHKGAIIKAEKDVRFRHMENGHLQIRGIKKADEGTYICEARVMQTGELSFKMIEVVVNVLPTIRARQAEVNATADIGSPALLACDADGFPEPIVTWTYNNVVLQSGDKYSLNEDGSELLIRDVVKVDEGDYTCIARNKAGEKSLEVSLNVFVQAKITYLSNQTASEFDDEVTLTCEASGDPTPSISWSFENRMFTEGEQSHDRNIVVRSHARVSSLLLKNVQFTYAGQYLCTASNSIGQDNQPVYLEVRYAPKILGSVTTYTWEGNPANISCVVEAHPEASMTWFRDGLQLPTTNTTNVKIYNTPSVSYLEVSPESQSDFGSYNCTATNVMGTEYKEFLLIQAEVPSSPEIQQVEPFSSSAVVEFDEPDSFGGVPLIKYRLVWRKQWHQDWTTMEYSATEDMTRITIAGLKPETTYEIKMSAINGKGEGESSPTSTFKTKPVREPTAPKLEAMIQNQGNSLKVNWIKQDDGGSPIKHYLVRYKAKHVSDWKPEIRVPHGSEYVVLSGLDWNTEYEVRVVAENQQGKSEPGVIAFRTATEPTTMPGASGGGSGLSTGAIVGILMVVFFLLLVGVDVTCFFLNKCGLLMCIAVNFCGKAGPGAKGKDIEEGKAAFTKDESKEPIVEVRTEEDQTKNQEGVGATEPNETTPLTEPEPATATDVTRPPSSAITNSVAAHNSPAAESGESQPDVGPLVDLSDSAKAPPLASEPGSAPSEAPASTLSQDSQVDAHHHPPSTESSTTTPAQNDGKTKEDVKMKEDVKTEANNATAEVKTVPNEAPQTNGNESRA